MFYFLWLGCFKQPFFFISTLALSLNLEKYLTLSPFNQILGYKNYFILLYNTHNNTLFIWYITGFWIFFCFSFSFTWIVLIFIYTFWANFSVNILFLNVFELTTHLQIALVNGFSFIHPPLLLLSYMLFLWHSIKNYFNIIGYYRYSLIFFKRYTFYFIIILCLAITLGALWAQHELNWGGWWSWDSVEILSLFLLIFLLGVIHTSKKKHWWLFYKNIFFFTIFIVCLTTLVKINILSSVHNFTLTAENTQYLEYVFIVYFFLFSKVYLKGYYLFFSTFWAYIFVLFFIFYKNYNYFKFFIFFFKYFLCSPVLYICLDARLSGLVFKKFFLFNFSLSELSFLTFFRVKFVTKAIHLIFFLFLFLCFSQYKYYYFTTFFSDFSYIFFKKLKYPTDFGMCCLSFYKNFVYVGELLNTHNLNFIKNVCTLPACFFYNTFHFELDDIFYKVMLLIIASYFYFLFVFLKKKVY